MTDPSKSLFLQPGIAEQPLRDAALSVSRIHGDEVFRELVSALANILHLEFAFIATGAENDPTTMSMLAFYGNGQIGERFDYPIKHTPCETVVGQTYRAYLSDLATHFPHHAEIKVWGVQAYAGFPLTDQQGNARGIISVLSRRPITHPEIVESVLKIFATRASAEIGRLRAEQELRARDAQLRQAQKMEAIGHLTGGIAHDFNNILTSILGYLMLASERVEEHYDDEKLLRFLDEANSSALRARDLIKQMLTFSRGQRGSPRPIDLAQVIGEGINMLRPTLPATIALNTRLDRDAGLVMLDPVHLGQILLNLCINARDAMEGAGRISIRVTAMDVEHTVCASCRRPADGRYVALTVRDTGAGITPEVQERMFEPFYTTKDVGKGTGMGLATVHGILHEHGGHVLVDSAPGRGTRFRVLFPILSPAAQDSADDSSAIASSARRPRLRGRVLVVDDERAVGAFMRDLLLGWGLNVVVEANPQRALELIRAKPDDYDLLITDQSMPKLTGLDLAERVRSERPNLAIVLYTGYVEDLEESRWRTAGVRALLRKPVDAAQLFEVVRTNLPECASQPLSGTNM